MICVDCGKKIDSRAKRCRYCAHKGALNKTWKQRPSCLDCGKILTQQHHTRCRECFAKFQRGVNHPLFGKKYTEEEKSKMSNSLKGVMSGELCHTWKGGITPLTLWIRSMVEYKQWIKQVFERDNYTCQQCFGRGGNKHAHHINPFSNIVKDFLQEYNQFSPVDDKETLVRLAVKYKPFWDIANGKTLCPDCHKIGVHQCQNKL